MEENAEEARVMKSARMRRGSVYSMSEGVERC